jgi:CBS domain-containing protein
MLVREAMVTDVTVIAPDTTIDAVAQIMADLDLGALPIGRPGERPDGIITGRDILLRVVVAPRRDPRVTRVETVMSAHLFCCRPEDDVEDVLREMERHQVRRMPVCDAKARLVGMVTRGDLERARSGANQLRYGRE